MRALQHPVKERRGNLPLRCCPRAFAGPRASCECLPEAWEKGFKKTEMAEHMAAGIRGGWREDRPRLAAKDHPK